MKILFFLDPLVEASLPVWKAGWIWPVRDMILGLLAAKEQPPEGFQFICICSDLMLSAVTNVLPECEIRVISQERLVPELGRSGLDIAVGWTAQPSDPRQMQKMAEHVLVAYPDGPPDICVTFSPAPFLRVAFPACPILHRENGMLSVAPFISTTYLDPAGMHMHSVLALLSSEILRYQPDESENDFVDAMREHYRRRLFETQNPLKEWATSSLKGYERAVLLCLQAEQFYSYTAYADFPDQYDLLMHVLNSVPPSVAVICTEHPRFPAIPEATIRFLQHTYPNLLWDPILRNVDGASQFLMEFIDTVITVSSSIGFQTLLWKKRLIVAGSSQLDFIADSHDIRDAAVFKPGIDSNVADSVLAWLLTRYFLPTSLLHDGDFLLSRFTREIESLSDAKLKRREPLAIDPALLKHAHLATDIKFEKSFLGSVSATPLTNMVVFAAAAGEEFSDETCFTYRVSVLAESQKIRLTFPTDGRNVTRLRIDPSDRQDLFETSEIVVIGDDSHILWSWHTGEAFPRSVSGILTIELAGCVLLKCMNDDPQIECELSLSSQPLRSITVELDIKLANPLTWLADTEASMHTLEGELKCRRDQLKHLRDHLNWQRAQLAEEIHLARAHFMDFARERSEWKAENSRLRVELANASGDAGVLRNKLSAADHQLEGMRSSLSWRATAPFRQIRNARRK